MNFFYVGVGLPTTYDRWTFRRLFNIPVIINNISIITVTVIILINLYFFFSPNNWSNFVQIRHDFSLAPQMAEIRNWSKFVKNIWVIFRTHFWRALSTRPEMSSAKSAAAAIPSKTPFFIGGSTFMYKIWPQKYIHFISFKA